MSQEDEKKSGYRDVYPNHSHIPPDWKDIRTIRIYDVRRKAEHCLY
jgi:hypothetical protein